MNFQITSTGWRIKYQKSTFYLFFILILASILRLYQLGVNPPSLDWDEASLGYNAYSLLKTGKDEFGRSWPISIRSFEDYKPALYSYLTIPPIAIFGLNEFAVRLPSALLGILTILFTYLLIKEFVTGTLGKLMIGSKTIEGSQVALLSALILTISPWHLQFSRVAFESNISLFFVVSGLYCFLKGLKSGKWFILSFFLLSLSFYSYHSPRLVVPLIILGWFWYYRHQLKLQKNWITIGIVFTIILLVPFTIELFHEGKARLSSVTVLTPQGRLDDSIKLIEFDKSRGFKLEKIFHNRRIIYALAVAKGYLDHFNLDFLFFTGDAPDRHHAKDNGMLYYWEAASILIGILVILRNKNSFPIIWWFLVAPSASAFTTGTPHAVRALLYLPTYQFFSAIGAVVTFKFVKYNLKQYSILRWFTLTIFLFFTLNIYYYFEMYYIHTPIEASKEWQYGYKQAVLEIKKYENSVDKIIMTYAYDQPHVFVLFYNQIDPTWYQKQWNGGEVKRADRSFGKYEFREIRWDEVKNLKNVLLIGTPGEIPESAEGKVKEINFLNGTIALRIVKR